jgi:hypothetical protein
VADPELVNLEIKRLRKRARLGLGDRAHERIGAQVAPGLGAGRASGYAQEQRRL